MKKNENIYSEIDLLRTGELLRFRIEEAGYTVRDIQEYLMLSWPQPIYRWFSGKVLPSIQHLYAISILLGVHMEDLLATKVDTDSSVTNQVFMLHLSANEFTLTR